MWVVGWLEVSLARQAKEHAVVVKLAELFCDFGGCLGFADNGARLLVCAPSLLVVVADPFDEALGFPFV